MSGTVGEREGIKGREWKGNGEENGEMKQETLNFGYDNSYTNYSLSSLSSSTINQPLPGQPPLPPMPPPPGTVPPPPPHVYSPLHIAQVTPIQTWTRPPPPWQWMTSHASPLPPQSPRDMATNSFQREIPLRGNYIGRDRFNHNRNSTYIQRSNFHRKNRRHPRFEQTHGQFDQTTYFGPAVPSGMNLDWQRNSFPTPTADALTNHIPVQPVRPTRITMVGRHREESIDQDVRIVTEKVFTKKLKQRKPMSQCYPSRPWNHEDAEKALRIENEYNKTVKAQSLIIKFPDPDLNKDIVREFHSGIQNIHFQSPSGPRYCFIQMAENVDIDEAIKELEKIPFSVGHLKVERKSLRDEDNPVPEEIDPYTLYIGNLPESVNVNEVKSKFPTAVRVDVGYAQKMRNTRYAFMRYNSVDESISAYKKAHNLMWDTRSIIVRFRRQRGNTCLPGEPKSNLKKVKEELKTVTQDKNEQQTNGIQQKQFKQEPSVQDYSRLQINNNNVKSKASCQAQQQSNINLTSTSQSSSTLSTSVAPAKTVQQQQQQQQPPWTSQPSQISSASDAPPPCPVESDLVEKTVMLTEIKEEPEDYEEMEIPEDMQIKEDVDDDDDDDDNDDDDDEEDEDDSDDDDDDDEEIENEEEETDDGWTFVRSDKPKLARKDTEPVDHLDQMFNDLENAADGIGF